MQRIALAPGAAIQLNNWEYIVDEVIGDGATCIVYSAWYTDSAGFRHRVNLKECYPYHARIIRVQQDLQWESQDEQTQYFKSFINTYEKLMSWQDENSSVKVFDLCKANNTLYIIMNADKGTTFDKANSNSLCDILKTIQLLSHFVGKYHENGYLHLDIKPSNFLIYPRPSEHIILFDMDSVTAMDDIQSGKIHCVSYSDGWAAPEQKQAKITKLCPATDIYAIGAILFEKIMGRQVTPSDMGVFATWNFDANIFEDVNPKIKRILRDIFHKTLAANSKRRYQSTAELTEVLILAYEVASAKQFIVAPELQIPSHFIGRESEIRAIHNELQNNKNAVFLHGIGGIGKSTLAAAYALSHKTDYDTVLFCRYKNSLEDLLNDLVDEIQNFEGDTRDGIRLLKRLLDKDTLLIIDNFDVATDKDPYLHQFLKLKAKLLFTTRTDFKSNLSKSSVQLEVSPLPYNQLQSLFSDLSHITIDTEEKQHCLRTLLQTIDHHTYITELLARQVVSSGWSLDTLVRKIKTGISNLSTAERVQATKDEQSPKQTIPEGLRVLFNLAELDDHSKQVLRNMYLLDGFLIVTKDTYKRFCTSELRVESSFSYFFVPDSSLEISVLNDICELGWVQEVHSRYTLHPLVSELIREDLNPCKENCIKLYEYLNAILLLFKRNYEFDEAYAKEHENHYDLLCEYLAHADFEISDNRQMALDFIDAVIDTFPEWMEEHSDCRNMIEKLRQASRKVKFSAQEEFEVHLTHFKVGLWRFMDCYYDAARDEYLFDSYRSVQNAVIQLTAAEKEIANTRIADEIKRKLTQDHHHLPIDFVKLVCHERPAVFEVLSDYQKYWYDLSSQKPKSIFDDLSEYEITDSKECSDQVEDDNHLEIWQEQINRMYDEFCNAKDKLSYSHSLYAQSGLEIYQVVGCLLEFCNRFFQYVSDPRHGHASEKVQKYIETVDWHGIKSTIDFSEELQLTEQWREEFYGYDLEGDSQETARYSIYYTNQWYIDLAAILSDKETFDNLVSQGVYPLTDYPIFEAIDEPIWSIAITCWNLGKCHYILPHLVHYVCDKEKQHDYDERDHISIYEEIIAYAKKACTEVEEKSAQYLEYRNIINLYTQRVNKMTGKHYVLKREMESISE